MSNTIISQVTIIDIKLQPSFFPKVPINHISAKFSWAHKKVFVVEMISIYNNSNNHDYDEGDDNTAV